MTATPRARAPYRVRARTTPDGPARIEAADRAVPVDAGWTQPPTGRPGPAELLAASLAACRLKNLNRVRPRRHGTGERGGGARDPRPRG
ncbi:hypothetical protein DMH02_003825 [Streptomyces sp. WAC 00631]|uniref:hypothetical protein n=1 Tax=unclassified Streptomyces TaxID=2593676 RepID=UPI000F7B77E2|nr:MULTISPECIES: hypothetical protein [unclassified Streptomyces]MCC5032401.1 hypothetical protein [Streptomyces sp. WAC 00631]MCC9740511.1 hypothetical protein [Streptomyces sp. MNU89]